jgi:hypothetical protein
VNLANAACLYFIVGAFLSFVLMSFICFDGSVQCSRRFDSYCIYQ